MDKHINNVQAILLIILMLHGKFIKKVNSWIAVNTDSPQSQENSSQKCTLTMA